MGTRRVGAGVGAIVGVGSEVDGEGEVGVGSVIGGGAGVAVGSGADVVVGSGLAVAAMVVWSALVGDGTGVAVNLTSLAGISVASSASGAASQARSDRAVSKRAIAGVAVTNRRLTRTILGHLDRTLNLRRKICGRRISAACLSLSFGHKHISSVLDG